MYLKIWEVVTDDELELPVGLYLTRTEARKHLTGTTTKIIKVTFKTKKEYEET